MAWFCGVCGETGSAQSGLRVLQPCGSDPGARLQLAAKAGRGTCTVCWRFSVLSVSNIHALLPVFELPGCAGCKDL